jgi:S1-C subfamily serine protease
MEDRMENPAQSPGVWNSLSQSMAAAVEAVQDSIVTVHAGGRATSSGVVWRPGVVVTVYHSLRRHAAVKIASSGAAIDATLVGADVGTDLAVFRVNSDTLKPAQTISTENARVGELVLAVGRSRLGDISASSGIIARLGSAWRTWRGGQIDRLVRPDVRLYRGQEGSALVNEQHRVLGINSPDLARNAVITVPAQTIDRVVDAILASGHVPRPFLGLAMQAVPVPEPQRSHFAEGAEQALLVLHVEPNAPAATGGVLVGDLVVSLNDNPVYSVREFLHRLASLRVGDSASLVVVRGGAKIDLTLHVGDRG